MDMDPMLHRLFLLIALVFAAPAWAQDIAIQDAYARVTLHSAAIFLRIVNSGPTDDRLLSVSTTAANSAMLHENLLIDGIASMNPLIEGLPIPANAETRLERAGNHIMLMGLVGKQAQGTMVPLVLVFEKSAALTVDVIVDNSRAVE